MSKIEMTANVIGLIGIVLATFGIGFIVYKLLLG